MVFNRNLLFNVPTMIDLTKRFNANVSRAYYEALWSLKRLIWDNGLTYKYLAERLNIDSSNFTKYMSGVTLIPFSVFLAIYLECKEYEQSKKI